MITWPKKPQKELFADSEKLETTQLYIDVVRLAFCRGQISLRSVIHPSRICPYFAPIHSLTCQLRAIEWAGINLLTTILHLEIIRENY